MISAPGFCAQLDRIGVGLVTGVPCAVFGGPLRLLERQRGRYVAAANEGGALAIAAGAELAGRRSAVLIQNSGFGNLVNPLTSLALTFAIPVLVFMSLRGCPDPDRDEPQHAVMGRTSQPLLDALDVPYWLLEPGEEHLAKVLDAVQGGAGGRPAGVRARTEGPDRDRRRGGAARPGTRRAGQRYVRVDRRAAQHIVHSGLVEPGRGGRVPLDGGGHRCRRAARRPRRARRRTRPAPRRRQDHARAGGHPATGHRRAQAGRAAGPGSSRRRCRECSEARRRLD